VAGAFGARWLLRSILAALACGGALAAGCSDDDSGPGSPGGDGGASDAPGNAEGGPNGSAVAIANGSPFSHGVRAESLVTDGAFVYWIEGGRTDNADGTVKRVKVDGTGAVETIATAQAQPITLAVSSDGVFWANGGGKEIMTLRTDAGAPTSLGNAVGRPNSLTVDVSHVWFTQSAPTAIARARANPEDGIRVQTVTPLPDGGQLGGLAIFAGDIYFTDVNADGVGTVAKTSAGGGAVTMIAGDQPGPTAIVASDASVAWANQGTPPAFDDGAIVRVLKDGTVATIADGRPYPGFIVADETHAYWIEGHLGEVGRVARAPLAGGEVTVVAPIARLTETTSNVAIDARNVYWANAGTIWRAPK
jgi:hypothetical protein